MFSLSSINWKAAHYPVNRFLELSWLFSRSEYKTLTSRKANDLDIIELDIPHTNQ